MKYAFKADFGLLSIRGFEKTFVIPIMNPLSWFVIHAPTVDLGGVLGVLKHPPPILVITLPLNLLTGRGIGQFQAGGLRVWMVRMGGKEARVVA